MLRFVEALYLMLKWDVCLLIFVKQSYKLQRDPADPMEDVDVVALRSVQHEYLDTMILIFERRVSRSRCEYDPCDWCRSRW